MGFGFAISGSLLGLFCMVRARNATTTGSKVMRLGYATIALGGTGIWMMHFTAMIGFDVQNSDVRYDIGVTALSLFISIASVGFGIYTVGLGRKSLTKVLIGGPLTGLGVVAMHYTGMGAVRINGTIEYDPLLFSASVAIAVIAATVALAFAVWIEGRKPILIASVIMAIAVCGMHYTGMASVSVALRTEGAQPVPGVDPILLLIPIMVLATIALIGLIFGLLSDADEPESVLSAATPRSRASAERRPAHRGARPTFAPTVTNPDPGQGPRPASAFGANASPVSAAGPPPYSNDSTSTVVANEPEPFAYRENDRSTHREAPPASRPASEEAWANFMDETEPQGSLPRRDTRLPRPRESGSTTLASPPSTGGRA
ncbi:MHYT domain-containing protein [Phytomonospora sp. NPDC050363]|uniref:MHYT domain-containing protein n=1 Tax=Phytomonospora sp. NPDC050363 TaxID=3155642 RepID=UPI0033D7C892